MELQIPNDTKEELQIPPRVYVTLMQKGIDYGEWENYILTDVQDS